MKPYSDLISTWAGVYKIDPVVAAALFWHESFSVAAARKQDPKTIMSPTGEGYGIGQINPKVWVGAKTPWGETITLEKLANPEFNIRFALAYFSSLSGSIDQKYHQYSGAADFVLSSSLPKGYVPTGGGPSIKAQGETRVQQKAATAGAEAVAYDKWVVRNPNGTIGFASIKDASKPPKNAIKVQGGLPLTQSQLLQAKQNIYDDLYLSFQGRPAPLRAVANILEKGLSQLGVMYALTTKPKQGPDRFIGSPIWNRTAAGIAGRAKDLYGQQWKPDREFIRKAIVESWDASTIDANLRSRPEYLQGPEFRTNVAQLSNVYQTIYGTPAKEAQQTIREAAGNGWTPDQFALWLRGQPEYTYSPEYLDKQLKLGQALGLVTGETPTLRPGPMPENTQPTGGNLPNNQLVPGKPQGIGRPTQPLVLSPLGGGNG